jgi:hypothetical protein
MKPRSTKEAYWRTSGKEARKFWQQGPGAAKTARNFTMLQAHRAMRAQDKRDVHEGLKECADHKAPNSLHNQDCDL